jgi:hypothetical protein
MLLNYLVSLLSVFAAVSLALPVKQQQQLQENSALKIKFIVYKTGQETAEQLAMLPRINAFAQLYGALSVQEEQMPTTGSTYISQDGQTLHTSWMKVERTLAAMKQGGDEAADWVLAFELSSLPTDGSGAVDFGALIAANAGISVFLKRSGFTFTLALYRNEPAIQQVLKDLWGKRSAGGSAGSAFTSYTFWNPSLLTQIKFI